MNKSRKKVISINITGIDSKTVYDDYSDEKKMVLFDLIKESVDQINDAVKDLDEELYDDVDDIDFPEGGWYISLLKGLNYTRENTGISMKGILRDAVEDTLDWLRDYVTEDEGEEFSFHVRLDDESIEEDFHICNEKNLLKAALLSGYISWIIVIFDEEISKTELF